MTLRTLGSSEVWTRLVRAGLGSVELGQRNVKGVVK